MKRSQSLRLVLMGGAALALSACDDHVDAGVFETVGQCMELGHDKDECQQAIDTAQKKQAETAPRYASQADCEAEFGKCEAAPDPADTPRDLVQAQTQPQAQTQTPNPQQQAVARSEGGGFFMPLITGYMIGRMMGGGGYAFAPQPLYSPMGGAAGQGYGYYTGGGVRVASATGMTSVTPSEISTPRATSTLSRGGFGSRARTFSVAS